MFPPAMAGYDRAITIFSPEGKIYQVEYAGEAVKRGWPTVGVKCRSGVVLVAEKRKISALFDPSSLEKIYLVDEHVAASPSGLLADARILIDYARDVALSHRFIYDEPIDIELLTKAVCNLKQQYTQFGGTRPFGVALLVAGVDRHGARLFQTDPSGVYIGYFATAIGADSGTISEFLEKNYKFDLGMGECVELAVKALASAVEITESGNIEVAYATVEEKKMKKMTQEEVAALVAKLPKKS
ncbi:archaeal proteasome endopeptidase complex subunit alpha [Pyrobaculum neutrophilum]|uniref:Proteasome subunit alpha n=1 Tax=Pyrobaculum neutrophilum (strain DSM 2338 / JCM 9278 / NBRC 100436 / V24Sta) TaxID=444157 RepID=B1Y986_PYRNV|nr:archaeal proteasome endopeptidase complex subunit alpha [Pyrobaculum neutrophilum]ACB40315.1 Proteasome endopeptidase complex [Pyrobaculum neutrophilum V24Sta]